MQQDSTAMAAAAGGNKKKMLATLAGCNYAGKKGIELQGCINDVHAMRAVLLDRFGFAPGDVTVLTDDDPEKLPTRDAIKGALDDMVKRAAPGDVLFFHFSGHGMCTDYADGPGGLADDLIAPCDFKMITDLYFRELVDRVPAGATLTIVSDSCQSGGLIDQEKEQIGPAATTAAATDPHLDAGARARRRLPYAVVLGQLSAASGLGASPHTAADQLVALLGDDASAKFHANADNANARRTDDDVKADAGILLSGCQKDEESAEVPGYDGKVYGAFTRALLAVLAAHPAPMSNREVVRRAREEVVRRFREVLSEERIPPQHPCLYCSDANADAPFLGQQAGVPDTNTAKRATEQGTN